MERAAAGRIGAGRQGGRAVLLGLSLALAALASADTPPGFEATRVADVPYPTGLAFTPDGRLLITSQLGLLHVVADGALLPTPALDLSGRTCTNAERGLLGVAVDPAFSANRRIFLFYTFNVHGSASPCPTGTTIPTPVNRVSTFELPTTNVIDPATEVVILDNVPSPGGNHNAGDLQFGANGLLHVSTGDGALTPTASRQLGVLSGKILRIAPDGGIPPANPWAAAAGARRCGDPAGVPPGTGPCAESFAIGLRNPFRFAFRPGTDEFWVNDVGAGTWEEIDVGAAGADYGWNIREGPCSAFNLADCGPPPPGITNPIHAYDHSAGCSSITGGAFVPSGLWPPSYDDTWLFGDLVCGTVFQLVPDGSGGYDAVPFLTNLGRGSVVAMRFGPDGPGQALYFTDYNGLGPAGRVWKVAYVAGANRDPVAVADASPRAGQAPLLVDFDGGGSSDPDGDALTYDWDFGDGATAPGLLVPTTSHSYAANGTWIASLVVRDGRGGVSTPSTLRIDVGNTPPQPIITSPSTATRFAVGQELRLQGSATDAEDGLLPDAALAWYAVLHHVDEVDPGNEHVHPLLPPTTGNDLPLVAPAPEDLRATRLSWVEVLLTATDSAGLAATATQRVDPNRVDLAFATLPAGLQVLAADRPYETPVTLVSWEAHSLEVAAPTQVDVAGQGWHFDSWSDGGAASHPFVTPAVASSLTATFVPLEDPSRPPSLLRNDEVTDLRTATDALASLFTRGADAPSLDPFGPDRIGRPGEGALLPQNGSEDDDDLYLDALPPDSLDADDTVVGDASRPLVFYELDQPLDTLRVSVEGGRIRLRW